MALTPPWAGKGRAGRAARARGDQVSGTGGWLPVRYGDRDDAVELVSLDAAVGIDAHGLRWAVAVAALAVAGAGAVLAVFRRAVAEAAPSAA